MRSGLDPDTAIDAGKKVFRSDLYRRELKTAGAELPGASEKLEGAIRHKTAVASETGRLFLEPDGFFDDAIFDPTGR